MPFHPRKRRAGCNPVRPPANRSSPGSFWPCLPACLSHRHTPTRGLRRSRVRPCRLSGRPQNPVHAFATLWLYKYEKQLGRADLRFLERSFQGLMLNFNWWVNRKDPAGRNVFAGGFLGLDNIGEFDRSAPLPTGGSLEQADGTAWMAFYCQNMLEMALILSEDEPMYEEFAFKFLQHFMWISYAMDRIGEHDDEMWDEQDGFFYDLLRLPDGQARRLKVRSMVGLLPLCAATVFEPGLLAKYPELGARFRMFLASRPELYAAIHDPQKPGVAGRRLAAILN